MVSFRRINESQQEDSALKLFSIQPVYSCASRVFEVDFELPPTLCRVV